MYTPATCFTLWENVPMCPLLGSECVSNAVAYFLEHRDASPKSKTIMQLDDSQRAQAGREISPNLNMAKKWNGKKAHRENERETWNTREQAGIKEEHGAEQHAGQEEVEAHGHMGRLTRHRSKTRGWEQEVGNEQREASLQQCQLQERGNCQKERKCNFNL